MTTGWMSEAALPAKMPASNGGTARAASLGRRIKAEAKVSAAITSALATLLLLLLEGGEEGEEGEGAAERAMDPFLMYLDPS